jgi:hypothetical protein
MLQWVELAPEDKPDAASADAMMKLLEKLGCGARGLVAGSLRAFPGGSLDATGQASAPPAITARLVRAPAPGARAYFESTPIVAASVWSPLQQAKVKWRPTLAPPEPPPKASGTPSAAP